MREFANWTKAHETTTANSSRWIAVSELYDAQLRALNAAENTLVWFCSDNGGLPEITPDTVGGLRGNKGTIYEGGLRVPAVIEWPSRIEQPRIVEYPASVLDILPTILDLLDIPYPIASRPLDGISLVPVIDGRVTRREAPIKFRYSGDLALVDNEYKLLRNRASKGQFQLFDLVNDKAETRDISDVHPEVAARLRKELLDWNDSVTASFEGKDYPEGHVDPSEPKPRFWTEVPEYEPYFDAWKLRWEYASRLAPKKKAK